MAYAGGQDADPDLARARLGQREGFDGGWPSELAQDGGPDRCHGSLVRRRSAGRAG